MDSTAKVAEIEQAEKEKMKEKVERILKHGINCFINRYVWAFVRYFCKERRFRNKPACCYMIMHSS